MFAIIELVLGLMGTAINLLFDLLKALGLLITFAFSGLKMLGVTIWGKIEMAKLKRKAKKDPV